MIETIIVPIVKNKCGHLSDSNNCRPTALATIMSKLFESAILIKCEMSLDRTHNSELRLLFNIIHVKNYTFILI